jgi:acyl-coenzyme A synthetase/AMP-(fatty) acid ligase
VVKTKPDAPALIISLTINPSSTTISFRDLDRSSDALAGFLLAAGLVTFDRVGLDFHPSQPGEIVALLAVVKCGAIAVPLRSLCDEIVADAGLRLALVPRCDGEEAASLPATLPLLRLGPRGEVDADDAAALAPLPPSAPPRCNLVGALNILYTSGSTGPPKGVIGREDGFLYRIRWMHQAFPFAEGGEEVVLRRTPLTFVDSVWEIWGALLGGVG